MSKMSDVLVFMVTCDDAVVGGLGDDAVELNDVAVAAAAQHVGLVLELEELLDSDLLVARLPKAAIDHAVGAAAASFVDLQVVVVDLEVVGQSACRRRCRCRRC